MDPARECQCMRAIAMQADGLHIERDAAAVEGGDLFVLDQGQCLCDGLFFVFDQRAGQGTADQTAVGVVGAVGVGFFNGDQAGLSGGADEFAAGQAEDGQFGIESAYGGTDGIGQHHILRRLVIERAVRLDVCQVCAFGAHDGIQRAKLVQHATNDFFRRQLHGAATEVGAVGKARVRADGDVILHRPAHAPAHGADVTGMPAAGDIGRADQRQQRIVMITTFAEVCVEIDLHGV